MADDLWRRSYIMLRFFVFSFFLRSSALMAAIHHVIVTSALILNISPFFTVFNRLAVVFVVKLAIGPIISQLILS